MTAPNTPTVRVEWADSSRQSAFEAWLQPLAAGATAQFSAEHTIRYPKDIELLERP